MVGSSDYSDDGRGVVKVEEEHHDAGSAEDAAGVDQPSPLSLVSDDEDWDEVPEDTELLPTYRSSPNKPPGLQANLAHNHLLLIVLQHSSMKVLSR